MSENPITLDFSADELLARLLALDASARLALLDSCGRTLGESRYLIAGIYPSESFEFNCKTQTEAFAALRFLDEKLDFYSVKNNPSQFFGGGICISTIDYEFGLLLENLTPRAKEFGNEPSVTFSFYETLAVHDYVAGKTFVVGKQAQDFAQILKNGSSYLSRSEVYKISDASTPAQTFSNFTKQEYLASVEEIRRHIILGDIYQANLTQQISVELPKNVTSEEVFLNLRQAHPAPFAAFIRRDNDCVVSASPERFFKIQKPEFKNRNSRIIIASPIKGTRRRGETSEEDLWLRRELTESAKDKAENVMIVDLLRNDLGRVCNFGSVKPEKLFEIEEHESLFHLVSTVRGELKKTTKISDLLIATFPCGSITGAPKISAMQILDEIETAPRNLSMGAIGYFSFDNSADMSVAIRTMTISNRTAVFNVGGGIIFDSQPEAEYTESWLKAQALLKAVGGKIPLDSI